MPITHPLLNKSSFFTLDFVPVAQLPEPFVKIRFQYVEFPQCARKSILAEVGDCENPIKYRR